MPGTQYVGKAGHLAVMGELALRGYNVAMPEMDIGDDLFIVNDITGAMWRMQVKTALGTDQINSRRYQFRVRQSAITNATNPELHFVFVMRKDDRWRYLVISRPVLQNYRVANHMGTVANTASGPRIQFYLNFANNGAVTCSGVALTHHLEDWATWPGL